MNRDRVMDNPFRPREQVGAGIELSVQASYFHYSQPRAGGRHGESLPPLSDYFLVEVAILQNGYLRRPEGLLSPDLCALFETGDTPVAGYVSQADVNQMREQLRAATGSSA